MATTTLDSALEYVRKGATFTDIAVSFGINVAKEAFAKKDYSTETREKYADEGKAKRDGSYPIANRGDLRRAIQAWGRGGAKPSDKAWIMRRAKELDAEDALPEQWLPKRVQKGTLLHMALLAITKNSDHRGNKKGSNAGGGNPYHGQGGKFEEKSKAVVVKNPKGAKTKVKEKTQQKKDTLAVPANKIEEWARKLGRPDLTNWAYDFVESHGRLPNDLSEVPSSKSKSESGGAADTKPKKKAGAKTKSKKKVIVPGQLTPEQQADYERLKAAKKKRHEQQSDKEKE